MMMSISILYALLMLSANTAFAFQPISPMLQLRAALLPTTTTTTSSRSTTTTLSMSFDDTFMKWARSTRSAQDGDKVIELIRPLGLVLNQTPYGDVYVETVAPNGNAARTGQVQEGDIVTMCSATFGDEMWSCRGVGLSRVMAAIRVRSGPVRLVFESPRQDQKKRQVTAAQVKKEEEARLAAQAKRDALLAEMERDELRLTGGGKKKKFFGLF